VSTVTYFWARYEYRWGGKSKHEKRRDPTVRKKKKDEGVPALKNDDVTGMTEEKQEKVISKSGRAKRKDAAEKFYEEQGEQARETPAPRRGSATP
jgi:hypothetical protein